MGFMGLNAILALLRGLQGSKDRRDGHIVYIALLHKPQQCKGCSINVIAPPLMVYTGAVQYMDAALKCYLHCNRSIISYTLCAKAQCTEEMTSEHTSNYRAILGGYSLCIMSAIPPYLVVTHCTPSGSVIAPLFSKPKYVMQSSA